MAELAGPIRRAEVGNVKKKTQMAEVKHMMAGVYRGGNLELVKDYPMPRPGEGEALLKVLWAGICSTDLEICKGYMDFEGVPGHEFVGQVVRTSRAHLADKRVVGGINCVCGKCDMCASGLSNHCRDRTVLGIAGRDGAMAEYLTLPEANLQVVDEKISDEQAVFVEPLAAALQIAKQVRIDSRWKIAVLGDGRLGLLAAQVLANMNKSVMLVGKHPEKLLVADKRGIRVSLADSVVAKNDFDLVVECTGAGSGLLMASKMVRPRGTIVLKSTYAGKAECDLSQLVVNEVTLIGSRCGTFGEAIEALKNGQVDVSGMISRVFPLEKICEAMEFAGKPEVIKVLLRMDR